MTVLFFFLDHTPSLAKGRYGSFR